jgi:hypothetical protein
MAAAVKKEYPYMNFSDTPRSGVVFPKLTRPVYTRSAVRFEETKNTGDLFFRDPNMVMPFLQRGRDFVVYYITTHGVQLTTAFVPPIPPATTTPHAIIQTGARDATGCTFRSGGNMLMHHLFSTNLPYTFQFLLGLRNDEMPLLLQDLHYSTNDIIINDDKSTIYERVPNKSLSFRESDAHKFGVFVHDPNTFSLFGKQFKKLPQFDRYFTRGVDENPSMFSRAVSRPSGTTIEEMVNVIPRESGYGDRPSIFVFYSCANLPSNASEANINSTIERMSAESFFSLTPSNVEYKIDYIEPRIGHIPDYAKPLNTLAHTPSVPENWRDSTEIPRVERYYTRKNAAMVAEPVSTAASAAAPAKRIFHVAGLKNHTRKHYNRPKTLTLSRKSKAGSKKTNGKTVR